MRFPAGLVFVLAVASFSVSARAEKKPAIPLSTVNFVVVRDENGKPVRNAAVVVRNGLLFQKRWRHLFEREDGPPDDACRWAKIPPVPFDAIGTLPLF